MCGQGWLQRVGGGKGRGHVAGLHADCVGEVLLENLCLRSLTVRVSSHGQVWLLVWRDTREPGGSTGRHRIHRSET